MLFYLKKIVVMSKTDYLSIERKGTALTVVVKTYTFVSPMSLPERSAWAR